MPPSENNNDDDDVDVATNNLTSRFNDMFASPPPCGRFLFSLSSRKEYPIHVADDGKERLDVSRRVDVFGVAGGVEEIERAVLAAVSLPSIAGVIYDDISTCKDGDDGLSSSVGSSNSFEDMFP